MVRLYGRAGRLIAKNGGFRPGQEEKKEQVASLGAEKLQIEQELIEIRAQVGPRGVSRLPPRPLRADGTPPTRCPVPHCGRPGCAVARHPAHAAAPPPQSSSEKTMRQIQLVTRQLEAQTNTAAKPKEKFQEAIMSMVRFLSLSLSLSLSFSLFLSLSLAFSLGFGRIRFCTTVHSFHARATRGFGASVSDVATRPNPRSVSASSACR
jgi:hypothetical protein